MVIQIITNNPYKGKENMNLKIYTSFEEIQKCGLICQVIELFIHKYSKELWIQGICRDRCVNYKVYYTINAVKIIYDNINNNVKLNCKYVTLI